MYFMLFISRANPVFNFFTFYVMLKIFHADVHLSFVAPPALFFLVLAAMLPAWLLAVGRRSDGFSPRSSGVRRECNCLFHDE
jgi:hypothetical protein